MQKDIFEADRKIIAKKLKELRGNIKQEVVCRAIGISITALSKYESGERIPRDDIKIQLAFFYKVAIQDIFSTK